MFNVYGKIVIRKKKGCAYYYKLLNAHKKLNGWITESNSLEKEALEHTATDLFCSKLFEEEVRKMLKLNNLTHYLNKNAHIWKNDNNDKCWACKKCTKSRFHLFGECEKTLQILLYLIRVL